LHALTGARPGVPGAGWDVSIAVGFAIGSACFAVGPAPGFVELVGHPADGAVFFVGSIFFTAAALLELREATIRQHRRFADAGWWSAAIQFIGTLLFNLSTYHALESGLSTHEQNHLVWAPDLLGSACFLVSGGLAYTVTTGRHLLPARSRPKSSGPAWRMAAINLLGCALFGIAALASFILPSTGSALALAPANWTTALGGLCFLAGALLLGRQALHHPTPTAQPSLSKET
jgi:hypothetical protein